MIPVRAALILVFSSLYWCTVASADQFEDFTYTSDGTSITITDYTGTGGDVSIPATINSLPVTTISTFAFGYSGITRLSIPVSITSIGEHLFQECYELKNIDVAATNPSYSSVDGVLFNKDQTTLVNYPPGRGGAYSIPTSVNRIGNWAFEKGLVRIVTIPASVNTLGMGAFSECGSLISMVFMGAAPTLETAALAIIYSTIYYYPGKAGFYPGWMGVLTVEITDQPVIVGPPEDVTITSGNTATLTVMALGAGPLTYQWYQGSAGNAAIPVGINSPTFTTPALTTTTSYWVKVTNAANPYGESSSTAHVTMAPPPPLVTTGLASGITTATATLSGTVNPNGSYTTGQFEYGLTTAYGSTNAVTISPGDGTTAINVSANLTGLQAGQTYHYRLSATNGSGTSLGSDMTFLTYPTVPYTYTVASGKTTITGYTGTGGAVSIPSTINGLPVTAIGNNAFQNKTTVTSVIIPEGVTSIGSYAFSGCSNLTNVSMPDSLTSIGSYAFRSCARLASISIPASVTSIGSLAFSACSSLTAITVGTRVGYTAYFSLDGVLFSNNISFCTLIQYPLGKTGPYTIPANVASIGNNAFSDCTGLTSVTIPSSMTSIGASAFSNCTGLQSITIPASVASIGTGPFARCSALKFISVDAENPYYTSVDGVLFNSLMTMLVQCPAAKIGYYAIPSGVTSIGDSAFSGCSGIINVTIPTSVTSLGSSAFRSCSALIGVTLLGNAPTMGSNVFTSAAVGFTIYYDSTKTGFTTPLWYGYPTVPMTTPEIAVANLGGTALADGGAAINFSETTLGAVSRLSFSILNLGVTNLTGLTITKDGTNATDFTVSTLEGTTLPPGVATTFTITFAPGAAGPRTAAIHVASNDADENPFDIQFSGTGQEKIAPFQGSMRIASTVNEDFEPAIGLALDSQGNRVVTGWFDGTNDFGGVSLTALGGGGQDIFVSKYNSAGVLQWARRAGGNTGNRDAGRGVGVDSAGNVYVTGGFSGSADFGNINLTASQNQDFFLTKYDSAGTVQWVRRNIGGNAANSAYGTGLAVDGSGNSYVVGYYEGSNFAIGGTTLPTPGGHGCFLVKYDSMGNMQWAKAIAGSGVVYATKVAVDSKGYVCLGGEFTGSMTVGAKTLVSGGGKDLFVARFSTAGIMQWIQQAGGTGDEMGDGGVAVDASDNIIFAGRFSSSTINFGGTSLTNAGNWDAFIAKYNSAGILQWVRGTGGADLDTYITVAADAQGNAYAGGSIGNNGVARVSKYNPNGVLQWDYSASGPAANPVSSIAAHCAVDSSGNCHLVGWYQGQMTIGSQVLQPQGYWNYFLTEIPADGFAGGYPNQTWDSHPNAIYLERDGVERVPGCLLNLMQYDATHYAADVQEGGGGGMIPNLVRSGNRLQLNPSPLDMGTNNLLDFIMLSDGTNQVFASTGQEKSDPLDIGITMHSWSNFTGNITADDFVGIWTFESYEDDLLNPDGRFTYGGTNQFEIIKNGADSIELVTPWGYSLPMRVTGNQAFLEASILIPDHSQYFTFRICTDGNKLSFHTLGKDINEGNTFAVVGLGVKQAPPYAVATTGEVTGITSTSATLLGTVNPNSLASTARFEYGLTTGYGSIAEVTLSPDNNSSPQNVSVALSGLEPGQTYHYRLAATNSNGTGTGADLTFTTATAPADIWLPTKGFPANTNLQSDPNGDGVNLLMAYALNLDPQQNLGASLPEPMIETNQMSLDFYAGSPGVTYTVETSTDLLYWTTEGVYITAPDSHQVRTATVEMSGPHRYMRLVLNH